MLPVQPNDDARPASGAVPGAFPNGDETATNDGWAAISGNRRSPPDRRVRALITQACPGLTPPAKEAILRCTARRHDGRSAARWAAPRARLRPIGHTTGNLVHRLPIAAVLMAKVRCLADPTAQAADPAAGGQADSSRAAAADRDRRRRSWGRRSSRRRSARHAGPSTADRATARADRPGIGQRRPRAKRGLQTARRCRGADVGARGPDRGIGGRLGSLMPRVLLAEHAVRGAGSSGARPEPAPGGAAARRLRVRLALPGVRLRRLHRRDRLPVDPGRRRTRPSPATGRSPASCTALARAGRGLRRGHPLNRWHLDEEAIARSVRIRCLVRAVPRPCLRAVPWDDYDVVGFTSTFEQNIASLALARVKAHPGCASCSAAPTGRGDGQELHRRFAFVDFACSGEADESFPAAGQSARERRREPRSVGSCGATASARGRPGPPRS